MSAELILILNVMRNSVFIALASALLFVACNGSSNSQKENAPVKRYTEEEKKLRKEELKKQRNEGFKEGPNELFYENGQMRMKGEILQGEKHGLWISWRENGLKWSESTYNLGVLDGKTASFHENGLINYIGYYAQGEKTGTWEFYDKEGNLLKTEDYSKK
jgi:antitoxin component YwqK of YwqJK toxin-antitoxin module